MSSTNTEEILAPKPEARPRVYAYSIDDEAHSGLLKVGQTTRDVKQRIAQQVKTAAIKNYRIELDESAERNDGTIFTDHQVRAALARKGFENAELEWMRCAVADVRTVLAELRMRIPVQADHPFRPKPISDSARSRSLIPEQADHPFRPQADHFRPSGRNRI